MSKNKSYYDRRSFTRIALLSSIGLSLSPNLLMSSNLDVKKKLGAATFVDPMTAMAIAQTGMQLINSFSSGPGSPILAMMKYQNGMLDIINKKLDLIQFNLVEIQNAIDSLPSKIKQELKIQYKTELFGEISAAARRYDDNFISASIENFDIFNNNQVKNEITDIITTADQCLSILRDSQGGNGPDACLILPLAMSLEIAGRTNLKYPSEVIKASILKYKSWFDDMLSDKPGAIRDIQNKAIKRHDSLLTELDNDLLAIRLGLKNYKLNGSQESEKINNPYVMFAGFAPQNITGINFDNKGGTYNAFNIAGISSKIYGRSTRLRSKLDKDLEVNLIDFEEVRVDYADNKRQIDMIQPKKGDYVYVYSHFNIPKNSNFQKVQEFVLEGNTPWRSDRNSERQILSVIKEVNLARAEISLCSMATTIANNSKKRIKEYLELL